MRSEELFLVLSVDIFYDSIISTPKNKNNLRNLELLPEISQIVYKEFSQYCNPKISWLVSDDEVILDRFDQTKQDYVSKYDEVGLHCLISKFLDLNNADELSIDDYLQECLIKLDKFGIHPMSSRMMGCTSSNILMKSLTKTSIKIDSSALPKRKRNERISFDWTTTPLVPYFPSIEDYKIPSEDIRKRHNILEVPLSTVSIQASYDKLPMIRYFDLCFRHELIAREIKKLVSNNELLVAIIHPMELLENSTNDLFSKNINEFRYNIRSIIDNCNMMNKKIRCVTFSDLLSRYDNK